MLPFQAVALFVTVFWLLVVAIWFRRSRVVLLGGLFAVSLLTLAALVHGDTVLPNLGLAPNVSFIWTVGWAIAWLVVMLAYSPLADRIATYLVSTPPTLGAFRAIQQSLPNLIAGIIIAWILGGFLEELVFRGVVIPAVEYLMLPWVPGAFAASIAIIAAADGAAIVHLYQGPRAALVIGQLSVLFGVLFVVSGYDLWAVILCHGLYDTIAFIRFATGKSRYAKYAEKQV
jgi:membrane protease YdiL (CAAX protease family)